MEQKKCNIKIYSLLFSSILLFIYFYTIKSLSEKHIISNIILYAISVVVFFVTYILSIIGLSKLKVVVTDAFEFVVAVLTSILGIGWFYKAYNEEIKPSYNVAVKFMRHNMPKAMYVIVLLAAFVVGISLISRKQEKRNTLLRISVGTIFVSIQTMLLYAPNILKDTFGGVYHADAYINSIVNVLNGTPYEYWTTSIYGHYGLFYFFPVYLLKRLGVNQWIAITISITLIGGICFVIENIIINKFIKNDILYVMTVIANAVITTQLYTGEYYQINPHRLIFPVVTLLLCYKYITCNKKNEITYLIILWSEAICSIVWNFESGLICIIIICLVCIYKQCESRGKIRLNIVLKNIGLIIGTFLMALIIVNLYNRICSGGIVHLKEFIYPIGSVEYIIENLWLPLGTPFLGHFLAIALFMGVNCYYLKNVVLLKLKHEDLMLILTACMGLGLMTYYMNRVVNGNMGIFAFEVILVLAMLLDKNDYLIYNYSKEKKVNIRTVKVIYCMGYFVLVSMCVATIGSIGPAIQQYYNGNYNTVELEAQLSLYEEYLPMDETVAFVGRYSAILASLLDRDKGIYMIDGEDLNPQGEEYLIGELSSYKWEYIFTDEYGSMYLPEGYSKIYENSGWSIYKND